MHDYKLQKLQTRRASRIRCLEESPKEVPEVPLPEEEPGDPMILMPMNAPMHRQEPAYLEIIGNRIYFYAEIDRDKILQLNKNVYDLNNINQIKSQQYGLDSPVPIYLHINSFGGSVFSGFSAMDELERVEVPLVTIVDGCCASAATFMSLAGKKRKISRRGFMLIHQLSSVMWGKYEELSDEYTNSTMLMEKIEDIYRTHTKIKKKHIREILKHDLWFDAEKCLELGMVDEII